MSTKEKKTGASSVLTKNTREMRDKKDANQDRNFYIKCGVAAVSYTHLTLPTILLV